MGRYVDADNLDEVIQKLNMNGWCITRIDYKKIDRVLFEFPTADVRENVHGVWIKIHWKAFRCSECKGISEYYTDFCPNCGADMRSTSTVSDTKGGWDGDYYLEDC